MPVTFTPPKRPSVRGFNLPEKANVVRVEFEGQYSQRAKTGPNPIGRRGSLTFTKLSEAQKEEIRNFMRDRGGAEAFLYQVPGDAEPSLWTCPKWDPKPEAEKVLWRVRIDLIQEFDLN